MGQKGTMQGCLLVCLPDDLLSKIHVFRVFDHCELIALIRQLPDILSEMSQVITHTMNVP